MEPYDHTIPQETKTTMIDVVRWNQELNRFHARIAPRFARPEPHGRTLAFLHGILSHLPRKNGWQLAEHAREARPDGMQRLLSSAVWDTDGVRDDLRAYTLEHLGHQSAIVVIDETSFPKQGKKSAGVGVQYCGTTGQVENCQVGVFLTYVTAKGHTLIDRELYLPLDWTADHDRRHAAGIPASVRFQTKPELATRMLARLWKAQAPQISIAWIVADTVYGGNLDLRTWLEDRGYPYVLAVACNEPVGIVTPDGVRRWVEAAHVDRFLLEAQDWQRLSMSEGSKGPRLFDWACVPLLHRWEDDGQHWLLIRRNLTDPNEKVYAFVFAPRGTTLSEMVQASGARWHIEEDFETGKDLGLDQYEVRTWTAWYRHVTLVLLALAFLTGICARNPAAQTSEQASLLLPLTRPEVGEVGHLLGQLIWPHPHNVPLLLAWSWWRWCHRSRASYYHTQRRLQAG